MKYSHAPDILVAAMLALPAMSPLVCTAQSVSETVTVPVPAALAARSLPSATDAAPVTADSSVSAGTVPSTSGAAAIGITPGVQSSEQPAATVDTAIPLLQRRVLPVPP